MTCKATKTITVISLVAVALMLTPCLAYAQAEAGHGGRLVHVVIFHLKDGSSDDDARGLIADAHEMLAKIPSVREVVAGRQLKTARADQADKGFDVGLFVRFEDA